MTSLVCERCGTVFEESSLRWRCTCGAPLALEEPATRYAPSSIPAHGIWRHFDALFPRDSIVTLGEGDTPLIERSVGGDAAWFKLDFLGPSGSYKDRGMAVLVSRLKLMKEMGLRRVVEDSSGNAGASMAAYCAAAGIDCDVYVPAYTSAGKCVQIEAYGANLVRVPGVREDATRAAEKAGGGEGAYYASHNWNPWFLHGIKTWLFEAFETLPDVENLVVPVGQGSIALGAWLALRELDEAGLLRRTPRIFAVQSENCAPLAEAFRRGLDAPGPVGRRDTAAEGIASAEPVRGGAVLNAVRRTGGAFVTVAEDEIWDAFYMSAEAGLYVEPTSAAAVAGWKRLLADGSLAAGQNTVVFLSGIGLKATDKAEAHRKRGAR
ncbi:MAG: pyridoxal-phosphate dependent enzyme [Synergistaceae bacterium]|jgi:threonine synthase|nr:pyridoxal-phosphate dependent enzyme [Synergistaceae bacterium]